MIWEGEREIDDIGKTGNYYGSKCLRRLEGIQSGWHSKLASESWEQKRVSISKEASEAGDLVVEKKIQFLLVDSAFSVIHEVKSSAKE